MNLTVLLLSGCMCAGGDHYTCPSLTPVHAPGLRCIRSSATPLGGPLPSNEEEEQGKRGARRSRVASESRDSRLKRLPPKICLKQMKVNRSTDSLPASCDNFKKFKCGGVSVREVTVCVQHATSMYHARMDSMMAAQPPPQVCVIRRDRGMRKGWGWLGGALQQHRNCAIAFPGLLKRAPDIFLASRPNGCEHR